MNEKLKIAYQLEISMAHISLYNKIAIDIQEERAYIRKIKRNGYEIQIWFVQYLRSIKRT